MKQAKDLTREEVNRVIDRIQAILFLQDGQWDQDKQWEVDTIEDVAEVLHNAGLTPTGKDSRMFAASQAFAEYDFGQEVKETGAWGYTDPGDVWQLPVFLEPTTGGGRSIRTTFVVKFLPDSAEVAECHHE